jgi:hypothetical protein
MIRRFLPSPAMVVALAALVLSLGGSAYAIVITGKSIRNNSVTGKDIRNRSLTSRDIRNRTVRSKDVRNRTLTGRDVRRNRLGGRAIKEGTLGVVPSAFTAHGGARFAVLSGGGQVVRGRDVSSAARTGDGRYQVIFNADIRGCAYFATIGDESAAGPPQNGQISVASLTTNVNGVDVRTAGSRGRETNRPFHLIVMC